MPLSHEPPPSLRYPGIIGLGLFFALVAVGLGCLLYAYPPVPWNGDDWKYLTKGAWFYPSTSKWNPGRIFPETAMPFCGYLAAYVISPLSGLSYVRSIVFMGGLFSAASAMIMVFMAYLFFTRALGDRFSGCCVTSLFFCCFFVGHKYLMPPGFPEEGTCLAFYYYMPNMLNLAMLFFLLRMQITALQEADSVPARALTADILRERSVFFSLFLVSAYLTQFSMVTSAIIPAAHAGATLFFGLVAACRAAGNPLAGLRAYLRRPTGMQAMLLVIVVFWFAAALFELAGNRYAQLHAARSSTWVSAFSATLSGAAQLLSPRITNLLAILAGIAAITVIRKAYTRNWSATEALFLKSAGLLACACGIVLVLNVLVNHNASGVAPRFSFGIVCYIFLLLCLVLTYIARSAPTAKLALPFLALHVLSLMWLSPAWRERPRELYAQRMPIVEQWIEDAREAEKKGLDAVTVSTPTEKWPHDKEMMGPVLSQTFFRHAVISRPLVITISSRPRGAESARPGSP